MTEIPVLATIAGTFFLAGCVKGVIGLGLPTISLGLLAVVLDLTSAMALLLVPAFVTNVWQAVAGGNGLAVLKRIWPFLFCATATIWIGAQALAVVDNAYLSVLLGTLLIVYSLVYFLGIRLEIQTEKEKWIGPVAGVANGVLTGMTGSFVVPGVVYLQAIGLPRDSFVQAMGLLFSLSTLGLAIALKHSGLLTSEVSVISVMAVIPAVVGMAIGQQLRKRISEERFKKVFYASISVLGALIVVKSLFLH